MARPSKSLAVQCHEFCATSVELLHTIHNRPRWSRAPAEHVLFRDKHTMVLSSLCIPRCVGACPPLPSSLKSLFEELFEEHK